jgi:antitoxin component YwqK of YwqJK toxin-antitoxin module
MSNKALNRTPSAPVSFDVIRRSEMEDTLNIAEIPYETGETRFRYARKLSPDGTKWIREGLFVEYSRAGQILSEGEYINGVEVGIWRDYFENGQIAAEGRYQDGKEEGTWHFWNEDGTPEETVIFRNGLQVSRNGG